MQVLNFILLGIGVLAGSYTIAIYMITQRGAWSNPLGQIVLTMSASVLAFYVFYLLVAIWPTIPGRTYIRFGLFVITTGVIIYKAVVYTRLTKLIRRENARLREEAKSDS